VLFTRRRGWVACPGLLIAGGHPEAQPRELFVDHPQLVFRVVGFVEPVDQLELPSSLQPIVIDDRSWDGTNSGKSGQGQGHVQRVRV
jgi:hypothetical protein